MPLIANVLATNWYRNNQPDHRAHKWLDLKKQLGCAVEEYLSNSGVEPFFCKSVLLHLIDDSPVLTKLQHDYLCTGELKTKFDDRWIQNTISSIVKGKKIIELGCRAGGFLKFLKKHGATHVIGVTANEYSEGAKSKIGSANVVTCHVTELTPRRVLILKSAKPDFVLNTGLFESARDGVSEDLIDKTFAILYKIGALNYFVGSVNESSLLTGYDFEAVNNSSDLIFKNKKTPGFYKVRNFCVHSSDRFSLPLAAHATQREEANLIGTSYRFRLASFHQ